jgi:hypothetical protein
MKAAAAIDPIPPPISHAFLVKRSAPAIRVGEFGFAVSVAGMREDPYCSLESGRSGTQGITD